MTNGPTGGDGGAEFRRRLSVEVDGWERDGLVSSEQSVAILRRYGLPAGNEPPSESPAPVSGRPTVSAEDTEERSTLVSRAVSIIGVMGALLVGLGIIIYVAANWDVIPVWARVTMLVVLTVVINAAGWALLARFDYPRIGVAVLVAGALAYGAAIHLVAQIYHVPVNHPNLTTAWFLGVLPLGYIVRSRLMVGLSLVLLVLSMGFRTQWWLEYYREETLLFLAPMTLVISAAVVMLGLLQLRFAWTRPFAGFCSYPGLAMGLAAFCAMSIASIWVDAGDIIRATLAEYWLTVGVAITVTVAATGCLWWFSRGEHGARPLVQTVAAVTMVAVAGAMWAWFAYPSPGLWWLFNLAAFGGIAVVAFLKRAPPLLGFAAVLFVILVAIRFVSLTELDGAAAPILLAAAGLTAAAGIFAGSTAMRIAAWAAPYARYCAAAALTLAASSLYVMGYGTFWRWTASPDWSWMPAEYWIVVAIGWLLSGSAIGLAIWRSRRTRNGDALWEGGAVAIMAVLALAMWLGLKYQLSASWAIFNLALLAGIAALIWFSYRRRQLSVAYFACSIFAVSVLVRCFWALGILADNELLLWLGPVGLGVGALVFLTGRLRGRWVDMLTPEHRFNFRLWDFAGLALSVASVYAMSYSDPWVPKHAGEPGSALAYLGEYWFLAGTVWGAAIAVLALIWVVDWKRLPTTRASADQLRWETAGAVAMGVLALLAWLGLLIGWSWTWLPLNAGLLCTVLALLAAGYRWNRADLINLAVVVFAITLLTRYFEFGFGLLGQSLAFIVAGAIMLGMGFGLEFLRRRMVRTMRPAEVTP